MADQDPAAGKTVETGGPNRINRLLSAEIKNRYGALTNMVMVRNNGLNSEETTGIRAELREKGVGLQVVRNRVSIRAFKEMGLEEAEKL